jgi:hypothetical protein
MTSNADETREKVARAVEDALNRYRGDLGAKYIAEQAIAAYEAAQWQTIESAPKNGTTILGYEIRDDGQTKFCYRVVMWDDEEWVDPWEGVGVNVTRWKPLGPPPA